MGREDLDLLPVFSWSSRLPILALNRQNPLLAKQYSLEKRVSVAQVQRQLRQFGGLKLRHCVMERGEVLLHGCGQIVHGINTLRLINLTGK